MTALLDSLAFWIGVTTGIGLLCLGAIALGVADELGRRFGGDA